MGKRRIDPKLLEFLDYLNEGGGPGQIAILSPEDYAWVNREMGRLALNREFIVSDDQDIGDVTFIDPIK